MFKHYFQSAAAHLRSIGMEPRIICGDPVSDQQLNAVEEVICRSIPKEIRSFFTEMGDGFLFCPAEGNEGFGIGRLGDYRYKVAGFIEVLREDAPPGGNRAHPANVVAEELSRRESWFPFYNFGGGGYLFCLDLNASPSPVRYYERCYWPTDPVDHWQLSMADSFEDFVSQWSRYCFADAKGATLINVALSVRGKFDWSPQRFDAWCDRGAIQV